MNFTLSSNNFNFKTRRKKFGFSSLIFLIIFGLIFTAVGITFIKSTKIDPSWTRLNGQVISDQVIAGSSNSGVTYAPVVQYQVNGQNYQITSSSSSSFRPAIGSARQIAYDPTLPGNAKVVDGNAKYFLYIFPVAGIACLIIGPIAFIRSRLRGQDINSLMQTGQKLQGVLTDVQSYGGSNNNNGYKIVVSAVGPDGTAQTYISDTLAGIGAIAMADFRSTPVPINVYVNPTNPQDYYVDVSDIPNLTPQRILDLVHTADAQQGNFNQAGQMPQFVAPTTALVQPAQGQAPVPPAAPMTPSSSSGDNPWPPQIFQQPKI